MSQLLDASRRFCAAVMRDHAKSFYLSTRILPRTKKAAIEALYAFFRCVDDAVDEGNASREERRRYLEHARRDVAGLSKPAYRSCARWFPALAAAHADFSLDLQPLFDLIDGCELDLDAVDVRSLAELERYAGLVAGTVGRSVLPVLGARDADSIARAERLGVAMQYTNILRDVREDRVRGRNYLPRAAFPHQTDSEVMRTIAEQARIGYREAAVLASRLPNDGSRAALLMAAAFYENILRGVELRGFDPQAQRVRVSDTAKLRLAMQCVVRAYTGFAIIR